MGLGKGMLILETFQEKIPFEAHSMKNETLAEKTRLGILRVVAEAANSVRLQIQAILGHFPRNLSFLERNF